MLVHDVYFTLKDPSDDAADRLVAACERYLRDHDGVVFFAAGKLVPDLTRDVNQRDFHVALHVVFDSREAHDAYQVSASHQQFIAENSSGWELVRVFDSDG